MRKSFLAAVAAVVMSSAFAAASNVTYVVYPDASNPNGYSSTPGLNAFTYDSPVAGNSILPGVSPTAPTGYGNSSFSATVSPSGPQQADRYRTFRVSLSGANSLFGHSVSVGDLSSITYLTNSSGAHDWRPTIYTEVQAGAGAFSGANPNGNTGSFYHSRLQALPSADGNSQWDLQSSASMLWGETKMTGGNQTFNKQFSDILSGPVTIGGVSRDFRSELINFVDFTLGADNGGGIESGTIDGIVFTLNNGDIVTLNLEAAAVAVPLPASAMMGISLLSTLGLARRRSR